MRLPPGSIRQIFNRTRRFLDFVAGKQGACDLTQVDQALLDAYRNHLTADPQRRPIQIASLLEVVVDLHHFGEHMSSGGLALSPWKGRSAHLVAGSKQTSGESKTPRLPEEIISPLLKWSLKYITVFSGDILAARTELDALQLRQKRLVAEDGRFSESMRRQRRRDRLIAYLDGLRANSRGVPIWTAAHNGAVRTDPNSGAETPPINAQLIQWHVGVDPDKRADHVLLRRATKQLILDAVAAIGAEVGGMDTVISIDPDTGLSWRTRFDAKSLLFEERMLQAACYIVCAYLTGMRDAEVQAMRADCVEVRRSEDGLIERYLIKSTTYKARDTRGQPETWTTIEPVAKAMFSSA